MLDVNFLKVSDGVGESQCILQSNGVRQGGCLSPFLFIYCMHDINSVLEKFPSVKMIIYADDIVLLGKNLKELEIVISLIQQYLIQMNLQLNIDKCKLMKFRNGGRGRYKKDEVLHIDGQQIDFVQEFCYLGVIFQSSGKSFSKHINKRAKSSYFATSKLKSLHKSSINAALNLFKLAIAPISLVMESHPSGSI
jgi:hypothetical protein